MEFLFKNHNKQRNQLFLSQISVEPECVGASVRSDHPVFENRARQAAIL